MKKNDFLNILAQNLHCGYTVTLEPPPTSTHNLCFGLKIRTKIGIPLRTSVLLCKSGVHRGKQSPSDEKMKTPIYFK